MANDFLAFCPTDSGTNLLTQSEYAAATNRTIGNQPGVASSKLNNKAIRQSAYISSQVAQYLADTVGASVLDDAIPAKLLAQINMSMKRLAPVFSKYTSSTGTHNVSYIFFIATGSATVGATYTNNSVTYTVSATVASGVQITMTGSGAPTASGTLTKASGTGDSTLTFYGVRAPLYLKVWVQGAGGGGCGGGGGGTGGTGGTSSFGSSLISCVGGVGGAGSSTGGTGGSATLGSGPVGVALAGGNGQASMFSGSVSPGPGGNGSASPFGGAGGGASGDTAGVAAVANSGSGGGGGGMTSSHTTGGAGGGAGGHVAALINSPLSTYAYVVGAAGTAGTAGSGSGIGGAGGSGVVMVEEHYQ